jgi:hypothetical protein
VVVCFVICDGFSLPWLKFKPKAKGFQLKVSSKPYSTTRKQFFSFLINAIQTCGAPTTTTTVVALLSNNSSFRLFVSLLQNVNTHYTPLKG